MGRIRPRSLKTRMTLSKEKKRRFLPDKPCEPQLKQFNLLG